MNIRKITFVIFAVFVFTSCGNKYKGLKKTGSGLYYRFHTENPTKRVAENDEIVFMVMGIQTENDSIVQFPKQIITMMQAPRFMGDIYEALSLMHEGDSATFIINARKYYNAYHYGQVPDFVKDDETILRFSIRIDTIQSAEQYQMAAMNAKIDQEKETIANYLVDNNITVEPQYSGLYYIETKAGKGNNASNGKTVSVHYTGKLLDGTVFDSSMGKELLSFQLGSGQVIKGWEEGIGLMKKGGKAILLIPSNLAYGERSTGNIPAYSSLLFEVELVDIK